MYIRHNGVYHGIAGSRTNSHVYFRCFWDSQYAGDDQRPEHPVYDDCRGDFLSADDDGGGIGYTDKLRLFRMAGKQDGANRLRCQSHYR